MAERSLLIGIDGRELIGRPTGVGRYLREILRVWATDPSVPHHFRIFVPAAPPSDLGDLGPRVTWTIAADQKGGTWWEQLRLPGAIADVGVDVLFAAGYTAPLRIRCPSVVAIYDVSFWAHPEWFAPREGRRRRWITRAAAKRASRVITISEFSASEIVRYLGVPRSKIDLAPPGAPFTIPKSRSSPAQGSPIVLFVGSLFTRRRIPQLLEAFAQFSAREPDARLVLVGDNRTTPAIDPRGLAASLGIADHFEWREYGTDAEIASLYDSARVFAFLSDYEGFAMTPLEALARGVPSVLLDTPVAREVYGDAALFVPPDAVAIAKGLADLWDDGPVRAGVREAGPEVLERYSWQRSAAVIRRAIEAAGYEAGDR